MRIVKLLVLVTIPLVCFGCRDSAKSDRAGAKANGAAVAAPVPKLSPSAFAAASTTEGMIFTGEAVRVKSAGAVSVNIYSMRHYIKEKPATKSRQAIIDADVDKMAMLKMLRTIEAPKIKKGSQDAFELNGFKDTARIDRYLGALAADTLKENSVYVVRYDSTTKSVTLSVENGSSVTIEGADFMRAVWSTWFGKNEQVSLGDDLISKL
jgi:hypothetical protein